MQIGGTQRTGRDAAFGTPRATTLRVAILEIAGMSFGAAAVLLLAVFMSPGVARSGSGEIDWSSVPTEKVVLLYPGQSSWEWNLTESSHSGGPKIRQGKPCYSCHKDEEEKIGSIIVSGEKLEPKPVNRAPTIPMTVQAANDGSRLYLRLEWPEPAPVAGKKTRVSVMLDDGSMKSASVGGCWSACHDDVRGMPSAAPDSEMTKYLASSRTKVGRTGGGENYKSAADLQQRIGAGKFLEYWQAQLEPGKPPIAADGIILKDRAKHATTSVQATASRDGNDWIVTLSRALKAPSKEAKDIVTGKTYTIGIAVHPAGTEHRFHHVSLERTLVLNKGKANLVAVKR